MEPELPPAVLAEVCRAFRLGTARSVTYLREGRVNDNFLVRTDGGSYVLRRSHTHRTVDCVEFEHALMAYLQRQGFPTPPLRTTTAGASFLALDDEIYRVTTFVPGGRCQASEDLRACAQTLTLYHRLVAGYGLRPRPGFVPILDELVAGLSLLPLRKGEYLPAPIPHRPHGTTEPRPHGTTEPRPHGTTEPDPRSWRAALVRSLTATCARLAQAEPPPSILAHASCRRESFLLRDGRVVAMLDYDNVHVDARTLDLAIALLSFAVIRPHKTALDLDRAAAFIAAYVAEAPVEGAELTLISWYIRARILKRALARYRHYRAVPHPSREAKLHRAAMLLNWLDQQEEAFRSMTCRIAEHVRA